MGKVGAGVRREREGPAPLRKFLDPPWKASLHITVCKRLRKLYRHDGVTVIPAYASQKCDDCRVISFI